MIGSREPVSVDLKQQANTMTRHQRSRRSHATRHAEPSRVPAWVWLFTGAVLGAFIMFLMRLSEIEPSGKTASDTDPGAGRESQPQKPRFDFYDLLKETHIPTTPPGDTSTSSRPPAVKQEYLLQVASFKSAADADQLRAELILLNLDAYIENAVIRNGETWHRVLVGPFTSKSKLAKARSILLSNRHEALVLKRRLPHG